MTLKHVLVTYIGQSTRLPHLRGVFAARKLKQFTPIEIIPHAHSLINNYNNCNNSDNNNNNNNSKSERLDELASSTVSNDYCEYNMSNVNKSEEQEIREAKLSSKYEEEEQQHGAYTQQTTSLSAAKRVIRAPPYLCNLVTAPQYTISLRRFLALRHQFHNDHFIHCACDHGWYLLAPSYALGLQDEVGLAKWSSLHHAKYTAMEQELPDIQKQEELNRKQYLDKRNNTNMEHKHFQDVTDLQAVNSFELSEDDLEQIAREEEQEAEHNKLEKDDEEEEDDDDEDVEEEAKVDSSLDKQKGEHEEEYHIEQEIITNTKLPIGAIVNSQEHKIQKAQVESANSSDRTIPSIAEEHLFEINDGVIWTLPPSSDLSNVHYWKTFKDRVHVYEHNDGWGREEHDRFIEYQMEMYNNKNNIKKETCNSNNNNNNSSNNNSSQFNVIVKNKTQKSLNNIVNNEMYSMTEKELYDKSEALFKALTFKANVALNISQETNLVTLMPLETIEAGEELFLHYGREWWTTRLLSRLFCSAHDNELKQIRWIESLCCAETDEFEPFPLITLKMLKESHTCDNEPRKSNEQHNNNNNNDVANNNKIYNHNNSNSNSRSSTSTTVKRRDSVLKRFYLYNKATHSKASDRAVLAYAIRRSCTHASFLKMLLHEQELLLPNEETIVQHAVFDIRDCDAEVSLRRIRCALLLSLEMDKQGKKVQDKVSTYILNNNNNNNNNYSNNDDNVANEHTLEKTSRVNVNNVESERVFDV